MQRLVQFLLAAFLCAPLVLFAETKVFTDTDLKRYDYGMGETREQGDQKSQEQGKGETEKAGREGDIFPGKSLREELNYYNSEIASTIDLFKTKRDSSSEAMKVKSVRKNKVLVDSYEKELTDLNARIDSLREQRRALKIRVVEQYRSLPPWWEEPDMERPQE